MLIFLNMLCHKNRKIDMNVCELSPEEKLTEMNIKN